MSIFIRVIYSLLIVFSIPFLLVGWGILILFPALVVILTLGDNINSSNKTIITLSRFIVAFFAFFAIFATGYMYGSVENIDTTGMPDAEVIAGSIIMGIVLAVSVFRFNSKD